MFNGVPNYKILAMYRLKVFSDNILKVPQMAVLIPDKYKTVCLTLSQKTNFRCFQLKGFADDNFKFDNNGGQFSQT